MGTKSFLAEMLLTINIYLLEEGQYDFFKDATPVVVTTLQGLVPKRKRRKERKRKKRTRRKKGS